MKKAQRIILSLAGDTKGSLVNTAMGRIEVENERAVSLRQLLTR